MGMLNRLIGQASRTATPAANGRTRRSAGRGRTAGRQAPASRGLGGIAQKLLGGGRRRGL